MIYQNGYIFAHKALEALGNYTNARLVLGEIKTIGDPETEFVAVAMDEDGNPYEYKYREQYDYDGNCIDWGYYWELAY